MNLQQLFPQLDLSRILDPNYMLQYSNPDEGSGDRYLVMGADGQTYGINTQNAYSPTMLNDEGQAYGNYGGSVGVTHHYGTGDSGGGQYYEYNPSGALQASRDYQNYTHNVRDAVGMSAMVLGGAVAAGMGAAGAGAGAAGGASTSGAIGGGMGAGDATAAGYAGLDAASTSTLGGGASGAFGGAADIGGIGGAAGVGAGGVGAGGGAGAAGGTAGGGATGGGMAGNAAGGGFSMEGTLKALGPQLVSGGASLIGGAMNNRAAKDAAGIQAGAAQSGIDETRRQYDTMTNLLQPYVDAGRRGLAGYEGLAGTQGAAAQAQAITDLQGTPMWGSTVKAGEDAILQNVAATGGLRGGNVQDALAKFRAGLLTDQVNQQLGRYGNLASMGQNSAARVGTAGMSSADSIAKLLQQQGSANAGGVMAGNNAIVNSIGTIGGMGSAYLASQPVATSSIAPGYSLGDPTALPTGDFARMDRRF